MDSIWTKYLLVVGVVGFWFVTALCIKYAANYWLRRSRVKAKCGVSLAGAMFLALVPLVGPVGLAAAIATRIMFDRSVK